MKNAIHKVCFLCLFFFSQHSFAQSIPAPEAVPLETRHALDYRVNKSDAVVEGVVINQPRWAGGFLLDSNSDIVFTSIIIRVSRVFKGDIKDTVIELIVDGGTFPSGKHKGSSGPSMWGLCFRGYEGVFFLRTNNSSIRSGRNIQSFFYVYPNSYIVYADNSMHLPYTEAYYDGKKITDFEKDLYKPIEAITGKPAKVMGLNSFEAAAVAKKQQR